MNCLDELKKVTADYLKALEDYRKIAKSDLVPRVDGMINEAKNTLKTLENAYSNAPPHSKDEVQRAIQQTIFSIKNNMTNLAKSYASAKERMIAEETQRKIRNQYNL